jgi:MFS family permease
MNGERSPGAGIRFPLASFHRNARLLILAVLLDGVAVSIVMLFFNFFILARGYTVDFLGLANSVPAAAALALGIPLGRFSDRVGYRTSMLLGIAAAYAALAVALFAASPLMLLAALAFQGAGSALFSLSVGPFLMQHSGPRERSVLFSTNVALQMLAGAGGNLLAGQMPGWLEAALRIVPGSADSYQLVLLLGLLCGISALLPLWLAKTALSPGAPPADAGREKRTAWTAEEKWFILRVCTPNLLIGLGAALLIPYLNLFFRQRFLVPDAILGGLFSFSSIFTGLAALLSPRVAQRLGSKIRAVTASQAGSLVFLLILGFSPIFPAAAIAFFLRAGLMNMSVPLYSAFCMEKSPEGKRGVVSSALQMAWQAGWAVGPFLSGYVQGRWGFPPLFITTALLYAAAIVMIRKFFIPLEAGRPAVDSIG